MSAKIQAEIQQVKLYDVGRQTYLLRQGMKALRPRRVFIAYPMKDYTRGQIKQKKIGWHDTLKELTLRIDVHPKDRKVFKKEPPPENSITKRGGDVLKLVDTESGIPGPWMCLDKKGNHVEWHSVTYIWRA